MDDGEQACGCIEAEGDDGEVKWVYNERCFQPTIP